jgi:hypothetical protein
MEFFVLGLLTGFVLGVLLPYIRRLFFGAPGKMPDYQEETLLQIYAGRKTGRVQDAIEYRRQRGEQGGQTRHDV